MRYIDLHSHTNHSDGTSTVTNSLTCAQSLSLSVFSVSDHNTVSAYREIAEKRHLFSGRILPAVELSAVFEKQCIEILGYGIDVSVMERLIKENYATEEYIRHKELDICIGKLRGCGAVLDDKYLLLADKKDKSLFEETGGFRAGLLRELKKHPENARLFGGEDVLMNMDRHIFHRKWISDPESPIFCDRSSLVPSAQKVAEMIKSAGGLCFLAHPFAYSKAIIEDLESLSRHLDGLECFYGTFTREQIRFLSDFCDEHRLYKSGGSDFHGLDMRPKNIMGYSAGERIEYDLCAPWLDKMMLI
ncbi:MAG: hypothetical protein IJ408_06625 [Clostridia bacterium]|nr:hypothetical protein [Clostridia bacterium]